MIKTQNPITITLDIGTMYGMPLLAVLFIRDGQSKLADLIPLTSKKENMWLLLAMKLAN